MSILFRRFNALNRIQRIRFCSDTKVRRSVLVLGVHNLFQKSQTLTPLSKRINEELNGQLLAEIEKIRDEQHVLSEKISPALVLRSIKYRSFYKIHLVNLPTHTPTPVSISNVSSSALLSLGYSLDRNTLWGRLEHLHYSDWVRRQSALALIHNRKDFLHMDPMCDPKSVAEGATLASFNFSLKSENKAKDDTSHFCLFEGGISDLDIWNKGTIIAEMQNFARMLSELPSNLLDPKKFVEEALLQITQLGADCTYEVRDPSWIESNLPGVHHVAKGSKTEPRFLTLSYSGAKSTEDTYVIVGKGVVFDTGGISLKPPASMELMRGDMSGAAIALSTILACAKLKSTVNLVCLIPLVENMPSSSAIKPGDLITMHSGKTVIVNNTDAEGRLILADTLSYAKKFNPKLVVNVATLTGASDIALGDSYSALFSNSNALSDKLSLCGAATGEFLWPMPMHYDYLAALRKSNADLDNISSGRSAGSGVGAAFLSEFVSYPWAHIDIGGTMMQKSGSIPYLKPNFMSGRPTRALIEFFTNPTLSSYDFVQTPKPYMLTTDKYQPISD